ncbi:MAG TPA: CDP-alcohol phosphatidyltransferase family protein [Propionibacteriaceae bacterium]|nr:CDP-alcohol phosphatidyltransferase family protein [Propionibacteriaceae bacterium]
MFERFRKGWSVAMTPPAKLFMALHIPPDAVTWVGTFLTALVALLTIPRGFLWQGVVLLLFFIFSDGIDGQMARMMGRKSTWGAFLDSSLDRIGDGAIFGAVLLYYAGPGDSVLWATVGLGALVFGQVTSYVKARGEALDFTVVGGLAARADRLFVLGVGLVLTGVGVGWALPVALCWLCFASAVTVGQRMAQVWRQAVERDAAMAS